MGVAFAAFGVEGMARGMDETARSWDKGRGVL